MIDSTRIFYRLHVCCAYLTIAVSSNSTLSAPPRCFWAPLLLLRRGARAMRPCTAALADNSPVLWQFPSRVALTLPASQKTRAPSRRRLECELVCRRLRSGGTADSSARPVGVDRQRSAAR